MVDQKLYLETLSEFVRVLLTPYDPPVVLTELARRVAGVLDLPGAAVSLARDDRLEADCVHDGHAVESLERLQQRIQVGPAVTAFRSGEVVAVTDVATASDRWPEYCLTARQVGIVAVAAIPLQLGDRTVGTLDLYDRTPRAWTPEELSAAKVMADMATGYLVNASQVRKQTELAEQLQRALDSRVVIEQAKGVLVAKHGLTPDAAFERIRRHARDKNLSLARVADAVVRLDLDL